MSLYPSSSQEDFFYFCSPLLNFDLLRPISSYDFHWYNIVLW
jgi:hypothetical protein